MSSCESLRIERFFFLSLPALAAFLRSSSSTARWACSGLLFGKEGQVHEQAVVVRYRQHTKQFHSLKILKVLLGILFIPGTFVEIFELCEILLFC